jgi:hypothetical protein
MSNNIKIHQFCDNNPMIIQKTSIIEIAASDLDKNISSCDLKSFFVGGFPVIFLNFENHSLIEYSLLNLNNIVKNEKVIINPIA